MKLSELNKTWLFDVDGTIVVHNGYKNGNDILLEGVKETFKKIDKDDKIILLTSRKAEYIPALKKFLKDNDVRYDLIISDLPYGERVLVNDIKPSGLICAYAINKKRDEKLEINYEPKKIFNLFYKDRSSIDKLCRYRSLFNIIATKYLIKSNYKIVKEYILFGRTIIRRIDENGIRIWKTKFGIIKKTIFERNI